MDLIFQNNPYETSCETKVVRADETGIQLDRTVFYPMGGGQPGDSGKLILSDNSESVIADTRKGAGSDAIAHLPAAACPRRAPPP